MKKNYAHTPAAPLPPPSLPHLVADWPRCRLCAHPPSGLTSVSGLRPLSTASSTRRPATPPPLPSLHSATIGLISTNISLVYDVYFLIISLKRFSAQFLLKFVAKQIYIYIYFVWMVRRGNRCGCNIPACSYNSENCKNILRFWFQNYKNSTSFAI
jgi:hypothetical protein